MDPGEVVGGSRGLAAGLDRGGGCENEFLDAPIGLVFEVADGRRRATRWPGDLRSIRERTGDCRSR